MFQFALRHLAAVLRVLMKTVMMRLGKENAPCVLLDQSVMTELSVLVSISAILFLVISIPFCYCINIHNRLYHLFPLLITGTVSQC